MTAHSTKSPASVLFGLRTQSAIFFTFLLCLGACRAPIQESEADRLTVGLEAAPGSVDPRRAVDAHAARVSGLVHASLLRTAADGSPEPWLATGWSKLSPTHWRFFLRDDVQFHDGSNFDAQDVVDSYQAVLSPERASPKRASLGALAKVQAAGPFTVDFHLERNDAAFIETASLGILSSEEAWQTFANGESPVGTGPYRIEAVENNFERVRLSANKEYFEGAPSIPTIEFRVVPDTVMRTLELRHGSLDFVQNGVDPDNANWLSAHQPQLSVNATPYNAYQYLGLNHEHPILGKLRVRRAIAHAIERQAIVDALLAGKASVADRLLPRHHWGHTGAVRRYGYDPERSKKLLDKAGFPDPDGPGPKPRFTLVYKTTNQQLRRRIGEAFTAQLARVGIELKLQSYEWGTFYGDVRSGAFHLYSLAWVGIGDPDLYRTIFHSEQTPPLGNNRGRYRSKRMDRLTNEARSARGTRRLRLLSRIQRTEARTLPYIPLWWPNQVIVVNKRLQGFEPSPTGDLLGLASATLLPES